MSRDNLAKRDSLSEISGSQQWLREQLIVPPRALLERITTEFSNLPGKPATKDTVHFLKLENKRKNRYFDIPCLDKTRIVLRSDHGDYVHANWVELPELRNRIILSQAPSLETLSDFYEMLIQERVTFVVCLTKIAERGVQKCYPYWPVQDGGEFIFEKYVIRNTGIEDVCNSRLCKLELSCDNIVLKINHLLYLDWPDHKVPNCTHKFLMLIDMCNKRIGDLGNNEAFLIHCSAGIGRSGTLTTLLKLSKLLDQKKAVPIYETVCNLREQRAMAVQGFEQYAFLYRTLLEMVHNKLDAKTRQTTDVSSHIVLLRRITTKSTCNLMLTVQPNAQPHMLLTPQEERQWYQELSNFNFSSIKHQTLTGAARLRMGFHELRKRIVKMGSALIKPEACAVNPAKQIHIAPATNKEATGSRKKTAPNAAPSPPTNNTEPPSFSNQSSATAPDQQSITKPKDAKN